MVLGRVIFRINKSKYEKIRIYINSVKNINEILKLNKKLLNNYLYICRPIRLQLISANRDLK